VKLYSCVRAAAVLKKISSITLGRRKTASPLLRHLSFSGTKQKSSDDEGFFGFITKLVEIGQTVQVLKVMKVVGFAAQSRSAGRTSTFRGTVSSADQLVLCQPSSHPEGGNSEGL